MLRINSRQKRIFISLITGHGDSHWATVCLRFVSMEKGRRHTVSECNQIWWHDMQIWSYTFSLAWWCGLKTIFSLLKKAPLFSSFMCAYVHVNADFPRFTYRICNSRHLSYEVELNPFCQSPLMNYFLRIKNKIMKSTHAEGRRPQ